MTAILEIKNLNKTYADDFQALKNINLTINKGEIFALLGPNGAGKTTLISAICGLVSPTSGEVKVEGYDIIKDYRKTREAIGLVPQELTTEAFEKVWDTIQLSRGLFGKAPNDAFIADVLKRLSLYEKKDNKLMTLSGGMKRRVMIAKALSHEPRILFLDEPTAGVDVELRKDMWAMVRQLQETGVTIILTTHYIEEAEEMADRVGIINEGELVLTEDKSKLMQNLGTKQLVIHLEESLQQIPAGLTQFSIELKDKKLIYTYDSRDSRIKELLAVLALADIGIRDMDTKQKSLEEIFVELVKKA